MTARSRFAYLLSRSEPAPKKAASSAKTKSTRKKAAAPDHGWSQALARANKLKGQ